MQTIVLSLRYSRLVMSNETMMQNCYESEKYSEYGGGWGGGGGWKLSKGAFRKRKRKNVDNLILTIKTRNTHVL